MELQDAFAKVLACEQLKNEAEGQRRQELLKLDGRVLMADRNLKAAWEEVEAAMKENGTVEETLPGDIMDYRIAYSVPRETVDIADGAAVPDNFCRIDRVPNKTEIGKFLKQCHETQNPLPNWATLKPGESKLMWRAVKKQNVPL